MNWRLVSQLSLFGLAMGIATVFVVQSNVEPIYWLVIFVISSYLIATRVSSKSFLHGVAVGLANSVWVTGAHVLLFHQYAANHPREMSMMLSMPLRTHPRLMMLIMGPLIGLLSGVVLGLFAVVARKLVTMRVAAGRPAH